MPRYRPDQVGTKEALAYGQAGILVAKGTGTTNGSGDAASTVVHGALDKDGNAFPAANLFVLAIPSATGKQVYRSAAPTATVIDIRSASVSCPYDWYLFLCN